MATVSGWPGPATTQPFSRTASASTPASRKIANGDAGVEVPMRWMPRASAEQRERVHGGAAAVDAGGDGALAGEALDHIEHPLLQGVLRVEVALQRPAVGAQASSIAACLPEQVM